MGKLELGFWTYGWICLLGPSDPNVVSRPQAFVWHCGVVVITTAIPHSTKPGLRFCAGSNPAYNVSEIHNSEDL